MSENNDLVYPDKFTEEIHDMSFGTSRISQLERELAEAHKRIKESEEMKEGAISIAKDYRDKWKVSVEKIKELEASNAELAKFHADACKDHEYVVTQSVLAKQRIKELEAHIQSECYLFTGGDRVCGDCSCDCPLKGRKGGGE